MLKEPLMRRYFSGLICCLVVLLAFCTPLCSNETSLQLLGPREGHPSAIVEGVNTITGDYSEVKVDLVVPAPDPLILSRLYSSGDPPWATNFGGWRLLSKCFLSVDTTYVRVGTNENSILTYASVQKGEGLMQVAFDDQLPSLANNARGEFSSWTNQKNNRLYYQADQDLFELFSSDLSKRVYLKHPSKNIYTLQVETLPSENKIFYEYDDQARPTLIKMVNRKEEKVLAWIKIEYGSITRALSSDEKTVEYHFEKSSEGLPLLTKVVSSRSPTVEYTYQIAEKRPLLIRKRLPEGRGIELAYSQDTQGKSRVHTLKKPTLGQAVAQTEFTYTLEKEGKSFTQIQGPCGEKSLHNYNKESQLTSIEGYLEGALYRTETLLWGSKKEACNLVQSSIEDHLGNVYFAKSYTYDTQGNVLHEKEYGNLTGADPKPLKMNRDGTIDESLDAHVKSWTYDHDPDFDIVNQTIKKETHFRLYYKKGQASS